MPRPSCIRFTSRAFSTRSTTSPTGASPSTSSLRSTAPITRIMGFDELIDHGERYDRMEEFIAVCKALWSSVDADAFVWDRLNGLVADPAKVRPINHVGQFFKVKGPLSVVPSPQGHPVLIQA